MSSLELSLLGPPMVVLDGVSITDFRPRKGFALLFYLAASGQPCARERLADLFWGDASSDALNVLRAVLPGMKRRFGDFLVITDTVIALTHDPDRIRVDIRDFQTIIDTPGPTRDAFEVAAGLYRGEFLEDFSIRDSSEEYEDWLRTERNHYQQKVLEVLERLVVDYLAQGRFHDGLQHVDRMLAIESWPESYHRHKMRLLAALGRQTEALTQFDLCAQLQREKFELEPSAELMDLRRQIAAGEMTGAQAGSGTAPTLSPIASPGHAPPIAAATPAFQAPRRGRAFVGRESLVDDLLDQLSRPAGPHVVALTGMGGVGKTATAVQIAHSALGAFPDGVLWADMAHSDPLVVLDSWGQAYGFDFSRLVDLESRAAAMRNMLANRHTLIILDDVIDAAQAEALLPASPDCAVLITTRDRDAAVALDATIYELPVLPEADSLAFLQEVLGEARVAREHAAAEEICRLLQHLPLALEITARRLKFPPQQMLGDTVHALRSSNNRLALLQHRHQEVRTSFEVSWDLLSPDLQQTFSLLGIFEGRAFTAEAFAFIAEQPKDRAELALAELASYSLLSDIAEGHFQQHALLAEFARECLVSPEPALRRTITYYHGYVTVHGRDYGVLEREWGNIVASMAAAARFQDHRLAVDFADRLTSFWFSRAHFSDARDGFRAAAAAAVQIGDRPAQARAIEGEARACIEQGDYAHAQRLLAQSLKLFAELADIRGQADVLFDLGRIASETFSWDEAENYLTRSRVLYEQIGDQRGIAQTLWLEADIPYYRGDYGAARRLGLRALEIQRATGDKLGCVKSLTLLADAAIKLRQIEQVHEYCREAMELCDALQEVAERAVVHYSWSEAFRFEPGSDLDLAKAHAENALTLFRRMGDRKMEALALWRLSQICLDRRELTSAMDTCLQNTELLRAQQNEWSLAYSLCHLGDIHAAAGDLDQARSAWREAEQLTKQFDAHPERETIVARLRD